jgi:hypothetical protein
LEKKVFLQPFELVMLLSTKPRKLESIHSNSCGPTHVPFTFGNKYIMTFIEDYTKMCWVSSILVI